MTEAKIRDNIASQYRASLAMIGQAIEMCPESLWLAPEYKNKFWHIAYHALFYTHFYLHLSEAEFHGWPNHRNDSQYLGPRPWMAQDLPIPATPYSKPEVLDCHEICRAEVEARVPSLDLDAPSGFSWLPFNKLELQFYNIRHLQHHTGQLADRLRTAASVGLDWVRPD